MCFGGGDDGSEALRQQEQERQRAIRQGVGLIDAAFAPFNENFYRQRQEEYLQYALPQYGRQYIDARNRLLFSLADRGILGSSIQQQVADRFARTAAQARQQVADAAVQQARSLQQQIEQARSNLINQLLASQNPTLAASSALRAATQFQAPSLFQPIGNLFSDLATIWMANQQAQQWNRVVEALRQPTTPVTTTGGGR